MGLFGGGGGGGSAPTPLADAQGQIAQDQWQDYLNRFVPLENEMIEMSDSGTSTLSGAETGETPLQKSTVQTSTEYMTDPFTGQEVKDVAKWNKDNDYAYKKAKKRWKKGKSWEYGSHWGNGRRSRFGVSSGYSRDSREGSVKIGSRSRNKKKFIDKLSLKSAQRTGSKQVVSALDRALMGADRVNKRVFDAQQGQSLRTAARYGGMTDAQKANMKRKAKLQSSKSRMGMRNATRDMMRDRDMASLQGMANIGRGLAGSAQQGLGAAAANEASRNAANQARKTQQRANTMNTIGTVAGIAAMAFMSDRNLKKDIESCQLDDQIAKLNSMKLYEFEYKDQFEGHKFYGPMIDEVPDEFKIDDELNPYNLISTLIATVQQLQRRVDELENKE